MPRFWGAAAALALLLFAAPCARADETVTVQLVKSTAQAPYYIALGKGYFAAEGLKIDAGEIRSALDTIAPLATGRLDLSMGAATAGFFNAANRGFDLRIIAALGVQGPVMATPPLVRKALWDGGTIRSAKDLKGRKVAINAPGDITEVFLTMMLEKYGLETKDVDLTPLAFAEQFVAFKNGAIDAGFLPEPLATTAKLAGEVELNRPELSIGEGIPTTFVFMGLKFMHDRPQGGVGLHARARARRARCARGLQQESRSGRDDRQGDGPAARCGRAEHALCRRSRPRHHQIRSEAARRGGDRPQERPPDLRPAAWISPR